jgi:DNA gyrase subunit A
VSASSPCPACRTTAPGIALATRQGTVKRVAPEWPAKGEAVEIVALRPGDEVVGAAELADGEEELVLFASTGDLLRFPASAVRPQGRSAGGMAGIKLAAGASVVGFSAVSLTPPEGVLDVVDEPLVVTGGGLPPEGPRQGTRGGVDGQGHAAVGVPAQGPGDRWRALPAAAVRGSAPGPRLGRPGSGLGSRGQR